jgi:hypothetical protein
MTVGAEDDPEYELGVELTLERETRIEERLRFKQQITSLQNETATLRTVGTQFHEVTLFIRVAHQGKVDRHLARQYTPDEWKRLWDVQLGSLVRGGETWSEAGRLMLDAVLGKR